MYKVGENIVVFEDQQKMAVKFTDPRHRAMVPSLPHEGVQYAGDTTIALFPWTDDTCRMLINIGVRALTASPFWKAPFPLVEGIHKPLTHQLTTAAFIVLNPRCYVLSDCRLGKTGSVILAMDYLQKQRAFEGGVLVITTVTTMPSVWGRGIKDTLPDDAVHIVHGKDKEAALKKSAAWYVTNYDSVRLNLPLFVEAVRDKRIGAVVIDELTHVGNSTSKRHKAIEKLVNTTGLEYVVGMTGSPGSNPEPVYGMAKTINPWKLPVRTKTGWMDLTTYSYGPMPYMRKPRVGVGEIIRSVLSPAIRFRKEDVLDLPPIVYQTRECGLSSEQKRMVEEFRADAVAFAKSGVTITAANAAVAMNKLLQVPLGFVLDEDGNAVEVDHTDRILTIKEAVEETERKVVIFSMFRYRLKTLKAELTKAGHSVAIIDGAVKGIERANILNDFQNSADPRILCCHPVTVGFGTELSAADTMIFDGPPVLGNFTYMQALERLSSTKQQANKISVIKIAASIEERNMFQRLDAGQAAGQAVAALFEEYKSGKIFSVDS